MKLHQIRHFLALCDELNCDVEILPATLAK